MTLERFSDYELTTQDFWNNLSLADQKAELDACVEPPFFAGIPWHKLPREVRKHLTWNWSQE